MGLGNLMPEPSGPINSEIMLIIHAEFDNEYPLAVAYFALPHYRSRVWSRRRVDMNDEEAGLGNPVTFFVFPDYAIF